MDTDRRQEAELIDSTPTKLHLSCQLVAQELQVDLHHKEREEVNQMEHLHRRTLDYLTDLSIANNPAQNYPLVKTLPGLTAGNQAHQIREQKEQQDKNENHLKYHLNLNNHRTEPDKDTEARQDRERNPDKGNQKEEEVPAQQEVMEETLLPAGFSVLCVIKSFQSKLNLYKSLNE